MQISLLLLFFLGALSFMFLSKRTSRKWLRVSFFLYSAIFLSASSLLLGKLFYENRTEIIDSASNLLSEDEIVTVESHISKTIHQRKKRPSIIKDEVLLNAPPIIHQLPELPRGCEITSLAMLLSYYDIEADKLTLAKEIKRNPRQFKRTGHVIEFGSPYNGFVGDMYSFDTPGLGVYHGPIAELAEKYANNQTVHDFSGSDFQEVKKQLSLGRPVWVIINSHYSKLPDSQFVTWQTEDGPMQVTYREHSVLVTGYDKEYVYFNDPLDYNDRAKIKGFEDAWIQMGRQAITMY